jgi:hypothetical protein
VFGNQSSATFYLPALFSWSTFRNDGTVYNMFPLMGDVFTVERGYAQLYSFDSGGVFWRNFDVRRSSNVQPFTLSCGDKDQPGLLGSPCLPGGTCVTFDVKTKCSSGQCVQDSNCTAGEAGCPCIERSFLTSIVLDPFCSEPNRCRKKRRCVQYYYIPDATELPGELLPNDTSLAPAGSLGASPLPTDASGCPVLPTAAVPLPLNCSLSLSQWSAECGSTDATANILALPTTSPFVVVQHATAKVSRCPSPRLTLTVDVAVDTSGLGRTTTSALSAAGVMVPMGRKTLTTTLELGANASVEIPLVPQTGIVSISQFGFSGKFGAALVVKDIVVKGATVSGAIVLRVCLLTDCSDTPLLAPLAFGVEDANLCCLPKALLCQSELVACNKADVISVTRQATAPGLSFRTAIVAAAALLISGHEKLRASEGC